MLGDVAEHAERVLSEHGSRRRTHAPRELLARVIRDIGGDFQWGRQV